MTQTPETSNGPAVRPRDPDEHSNLIALSYKLIHPAILGSMVYEILVTHRWQEFTAQTGRADANLHAVKLWAQVAIAMIYVCDWWFVSGKWAQLSLKHAAALMQIPWRTLLAAAGLVNLASSFLLLGAFCRANEDATMKYVDNSYDTSAMLLILAVVYLLFQTVVWFQSNRQAPKGAGVAALTAIAAVLISGAVLWFREWHPGGSGEWSGEEVAAGSLLAQATIIALLYLLLNWRLGCAAGGKSQ